MRRVEVISDMASLNNLYPIEMAIEAMDKSGWAMSPEERIRLYASMLSKESLAIRLEFRIFQVFDEDKLGGYLVAHLLISKIKSLSCVHIYRVWYDHAYTYEGDGELLGAAVEWANENNVHLITTEVYNKPKLIDAVQKHGFVPYQMSMRREV